MGMAESLASKFAEKMIDKQFTQEEDLSKLLSLAKQMGYMQQLAKTIPSGKGLMALPTGAWQKAKQMVGVNPDLDEYDTLREALMGGQVARKVAEEKGVLTDPDVLRALKTIPSAWKSQETENQVFDAVKALLKLKTGTDLEPLYQEGRNAYLLNKANRMKGK